MGFRKVLVLLVAWGALQTIGSCCNCGKGTFRWDRLELTLASLRDGKVDTVTGSAVSGRNFGLVFHAVDVYEAALWDRLPQCPTASACKCDEVVDDTIAGLRFTSVQAWDSTHPAGSDISDVLEACNSGYTYIAPLLADSVFRPLPSAVPVLNRYQNLYVRSATGSILSGPQQLVAAITLGSGKKITGTLNFVVQ